jgi:hypothetical protein
MSEAHSMQTLRRLMGQADGIKSLHSPRAQPQQQAAAAAALPSSNSTARHLPRLSEQCYQLAALAHLPKAERSPDFAAAAVSMLSVPLSRAQDATGLQMLQQDHRTGQLAVSLTGGCPGAYGLYLRLTGALPQLVTAVFCAIVCKAQSQRLESAWIKHKFCTTGFI